MSTVNRHTVADGLAAALGEAAKRHRRNEANFRRAAERALESAAAEVGIELDTVVERSLARGFADAVFNRLVVEWEPPGKLAAHENHPGNKDAVGQLKGYIDALAEEERREKNGLFGVACDGFFMIFTRYKAGRWIVDEPAPADDLAAQKLIDALEATRSGRALTAENLLRDFGPEQPFTRDFARALLRQLEASLGHDPQGGTAAMYRQWETFFAVATGVVGAAEELKRNAREPLAEIFGIAEADLDAAHALFALQTYFAIVTKLIAVLALSLFVEGVAFRLDELKALDDASLHEDLEDLQRGAPFRERNLPNVFEPDVFGWFLGGWSRPVREHVRELLDKLSLYDPKTLEVSPEDARDLLKHLYQGLLPRSVRHALGQYFTPDWLAELLLTEVGYHGERNVRLVDPACGTGTFLVLAIQRLKERLRRARVPESEILEAIVGSVVGFDIDPLAVVAARTNYVLALGSLLRRPERSLDLPVYLADSILGPVEGETLETAGHLELPTAAGTFSLPPCVDTERELRLVCDRAARALERGAPTDAFAEEAAEICDASAAEREVLESFYERCVELHEAGLDGLWPYVLRNAFMPAFIGDFDLVVGNPPWVNWESLPAAYRERTRALWQRYGLFVHGGMAAMLGSGKKDVSMLMAYVATDKLLRKSGRLGFVITQTVFKTSGAGQGFRRFRIGDIGTPVRVEHVDDMTDLKPFVGAANRTALLNWRKGDKTRYPVKYVLWQRQPRASLPEDSTLDEVRAKTKPIPLVAAPVSAADPTSAWLSGPRKLVVALRKVAATQAAAYIAHEGVNTGGANGVSWISIEGAPDAAGRIPITNLHDIGKTRVPKKHGRVEAELLHPLVRGTDIRRWRAVPSAHILLVQDPKRRVGIDEETMRTTYPGALRYLAQFKPLLLRRALYRRYYAGNRGPYWSMFNVGDYTLAPHKVVWKDIAMDFAAAVISQRDPIVLSAHSAIEVACDSAEEAHYLCAALNSTPARLFIASYLATHASTHPVTTLDVPRFDRREGNHKALAKASRAAHAAVAGGKEPNQDAVDRAAGRLWGLSWQEIEAMRAFFDQLRKRR